MLCNDVKAWQQEQHQRRHRLQRVGVDNCDHPSVTQNDDDYYVCLECAACFACLPGVSPGAPNRVIEVGGEEAMAVREQQRREYLSMAVCWPHPSDDMEEDEDDEEEEEEEEQQSSQISQGVNTDGLALQPVSLPELPELLSQIQIGNELDEEPQLHPVDRIEVELSDLRDSFYRWQP
jgi:hypothetical protein